MFWNRYRKEECPYVTKDHCALTHKNLDQRMSHQDKLLYVILTAIIGTFTAVIASNFITFAG